MRRKTANRINFTPVREPRSHASLILVGTFAVILILGCGRGSEQNAATFRKTDLLLGEGCLTSDAKWEVKDV
jgi:hypothetical protein